MIKAKKSLGQNFLINQNILKNNPKKLIVVEKDKYLARLLKKKFETNLVVINEDILKIDENKLHEDKLIVFGNLPYNISTEILAKWVLNLDNKNFWFDSLILMFQKEVADRIISKFNSSKYGRLTILANWKLDIVKICDIKAGSFSPRPKINSSLLFFKPKKKFYKLQNSKNLEKITRVFFNQRRKKIKTPFNILFNGNVNVIKNLRIDLNLRPHNLKEEIYYELTQEYEKL